MSSSPRNIWSGDVQNPKLLRLLPTPVHLVFWGYTHDLIWFIVCNQEKHETAFWDILLDIPSQQSDRIREYNQQLFELENFRDLMGYLNIDISLDATAWSNELTVDFARVHLTKSNDILFVRLSRQQQSESIWVIEYTSCGVLVANMLSVGNIQLSWNYFPYWG